MNNWIRTSERKPGDGEYVLVKGRYCILPAFYDARISDKVAIWIAPGCIDAEKYEHFNEWMPFPELLEEENK